MTEVAKSTRLRIARTDAPRTIEWLKRQEELFRDIQKNNNLSLSDPVETQADFDAWVEKSKIFAEAGITAMQFARAAATIREFMIATEDITLA